MKIRGKYQNYTILEQYNYIIGSENSNAPRSTKYGWMNAGRERIEQLAKKEGLTELANSHKQLLQHSYDSILHTLDFFMGTVHQSKALIKYYRKNRMELLFMIDKLKALVPLDKLLSVFELTRQTYTSLKNKFTCHFSPNNNCLKSATNQFHNDLVLEMKTLYFDNEAYKYFSLSDLFARVMHDRKIFISDTKFREIAIGLGEDVKRKRKFKSTKTVGLKSYYPNQFIQADKTAYPLSNGKKVWIYLVCDNYSRKLLAAHVSYSSKSLESLFTLKTAIANNGLSNVNFIYITDAGSENKHFVKEFIKTQPTIKHLIAQTDEMMFSNSMIEAIIKYFKSNILLYKNFNTIEELELAVKEGVKTYNNRHRKFLNGATPNDFYIGNEPDMIEYRELYKASTERRIKENKEFNCMKPCQIPILKPVMEFG
jgi:putative transposase